MADCSHDSSHRSSEGDAHSDTAGEKDSPLSQGQRLLLPPVLLKHSVTALKRTISEGSPGQISDDIAYMLVRLRANLKYRFDSGSGSDRDLDLFLRIMADALTKSEKSCVLRDLRTELSWQQNEGGSHAWVIDTNLLPDWIKGDAAVPSLLLFDFRMSFEAEDRVGSSCSQGPFRILPCLANNPDPAIKAELCLIKFCLHVKSKIETVDLKSDDKYVSDLPSVQRQEKVIGEEEKVLVRAALRYWRQALDRPWPSSLLLEIQYVMFRDTLKMVSEVMMACREFLLQLELLVVVQRISEKLGKDWDIIKFDVSAGIVDALTGLGVEELPEALLDLLHTLEKDKCQDTTLWQERCSFVLSLINFFIKKGQMTEAESLLDRYFPLATPNHVRSLNKAKHRRLKGEYLRASRTSWVDECGLACAEHANGLHRKGISYIVSDEELRPWNYENSGSIWRELVEYFESCISCARVYRHVGKVHLAIHVLQEGRTNSKKFGLLKWSTIFGLKVAETMLDINQLQPLTAVLTATYSTFSRIEPEPDNGRYSELLGDDGTDSADFDAHRSTPPDDLMRACQDALVSCKERFPRCLSSRNGSYWSFWRRIRSKGRLYGEPLNEEIDLMFCVMVWITSLVKHAADCRCPMCMDAECQLLALRLVKILIKTERTKKTSLRPLAWLFGEDLPLFNSVNHSEKTRQILQSAHLVRPKEPFRCGNLQHTFCLTELHLLQAEAQLYCSSSSSSSSSSISQALEYVQMCLSMMQCLPQEHIDTVLLKVRTVHLQTACLKKQAFDVDVERYADGLPFENRGELQKIQNQLSDSLSLIQLFPHVSLYSDVCKLLAHLMLDQEEDPWKIAALLGESAAVSLRYRFLFHCAKQKRQYHWAKLHLQFPWDVQKYREVVQSIPQRWTVCQFSVVCNPAYSTLLLTRFTCDQEPFTVELPGYFHDVYKELSVDFNILTTSIKKMTSEMNVEYDQNMNKMLKLMEEHWFEPWKGMLVGQSSDPQYNEAVTKAAHKLITILNKFMGHRCSVTKAKQVLELMQHTTNLSAILSGVLSLDLTDVNNQIDLLTAIRHDVLEMMPPVQDSDLPVIFIVDKHLANLPLEQLNVVKNQPITRVPSLSLLHHLLQVHSTSPGVHGNGSGNSQDVLQRTIDPASVYCVINPEGDLKNSEQRLEPVFESYGFKSLKGVAPTVDQYKSVLTQSDLFVYCGHGNGEQYFSRCHVNQMTSQCRAIPLLFGCSSARVDVQPHLDADAYFYSYLVNGSPCVLGNLWAVDGRDLDIMCLRMFELLFDKEGREQQPPLLASLVQKARSASKLKMLRGAAPVLYGLPLRLKIAG